MLPEPITTALSTCVELVFAVLPAAPLLGQRPITAGSYPSAAGQRGSSDDRATNS
jgi:hypothetical protein